MNATVFITQSVACLLSRDCNELISATSIAFDVREHMSLCERFNVETLVRYDNNRALQTSNFFSNFQWRECDSYR